MKLGTDNNERSGLSNNSYTEDRLSKIKKRKNSKIRSVLIILGYMTALIFIMSAAAMINTWIDGKVNETAADYAEAMGGAVSGSDAETDDKEPAVTFTQEEVDAMVEEAVSEAVANTEADMKQAIEDARTEVLNGIQEGLSSGEETTVEVLRPFYPEHIVAVSEGKFHFVPINYELKMNSYDDANLNILESGEYQYVVDDQVVTRKGIDVSRFQGKIDWQAVAADGVEFAFIRVANRGYGSGKLVLDDTFDANMKGAIDAGIHVGVYIFSQAVNEDEIREEFQLVMDKVEPYGVKCPIVFDVEKTADSSGRMNQLTVEERTNLTLLFCQLVEEAGYKPIVYHNLEMGALLIDVETLENYDKWFAYYNDDMYYPYDYKIWQYTDNGRVNGISGDVDLNICFEPFWEE